MTELEERALRLPAPAETWRISDLVSWWSD